ncbi:MAG: PLP-dependent aminotransferase family protein [Clostridiales bacterium]|nr:PLP-dependent aminotransferase family protein [Candidatus Crickella equi]
MKELILNLDSNATDMLYLQIYNSIKSEIMSGALEEGTKLPSLRKLADSNSVSVTTVESAYEQLLLEGYIESRPKSGYYVASTVDMESFDAPLHTEELDNSVQAVKRNIAAQERPAIYDAESFDWSKWKKCMNKVFNECAHMLQTEADVKGEPALRQEVARYLYQSRGVKCHPDQIIIGAGSQQMAMMLARIMKANGVTNAATETPGYGPIREILKEEGIPVTEIPMRDNGIEIEKLPLGKKTVVYVNPSNQFPTGSVMPVGRRYELIKWAVENDSYILEDDYDAEFRYRGKPIPAMQGLDLTGRVVYFGSFSSTLYAAIKISYMVLPQELMEIFENNRKMYSQTCSKAEQLCLAFYMESGYFYRHIKKLRHLYAAKLDVAMNLLSETPGLLEPVDSKSGIAIMLRIRSDRRAAEICQIAYNLGLTMYPVDDLCSDDVKVVYFYFHRVPEALLKLLVKQFISKIKG